MLLRIEDHDRQRCQPGYEQALLEDLEWLGFPPDLFPPSEFRRGPCPGRQSDREDSYRAAAAALATQGLVFACDCSRREIGSATRGVPPPDGMELRYPGRCRERALPLTDGYAWRVCMPAGEERFDDALQGLQRQAPARQCGDLSIRDRRGNWSYQFAVAVDDLRQDVALVIRGRDLLASTGRQIQLARWLGRTVPPVFLHHGLLMKDPKRKLSKAEGDTGVRLLRAAGWSPERVIGEAARRLRLRAEASPLPAGAVAQLFG